LTQIDNQMKSHTKTKPDEQRKPIQAFYHIAECAALAKCSAQTIMRAIKSGKLRGRQPGGPNSTWVVAQGNLVEYLYGNGEVK
jgi:hypothetical protein